MIRSIVSHVLDWLPPGTPTFVYKTLLSAPPIRFITNQLLLLLIPESVTIPEGKLFLNRQDPVVSGALALGAFEQFQTGLFRRIIAPGMTVIDIGANLGYYTLLAARLTGPGRVIAFEPEPRNCALLRQTIAENRLSNVSLRATAAANKTGTMELYLSSSNKGNHSLVSTRQDSSQFTDSLQVPIERVDDALDQESVLAADVIKIDIEGAEPLALAGMPKTLARKDLALFIEFYPEVIRRSHTEPLRLLETLANSGFEILEMHEGSQKLVPVSDLEAFAARFKIGEYTNLLCLKGSFLKYRNG